MKQAPFLALGILIAQLGIARPPAGNNIHNFPVKTFNDSTKVKIPATDEMLQEILDVTGLQTNFELKEADVLNIEASISHRKRYILYNPAFISRLNALTKDKWATMALLAHEVGHHLNGHTIGKGGSTPALELEADEFAGFILRKLGATLQQSESVMNYVATPEESLTHPGRNSRKQAIEKGWDKENLLER